MPKKKSNIKKFVPPKVPSSSGIKHSSFGTFPTITFSYKYFQSNHIKFSVPKQDVKYLTAYLERLRDISSWKVQEFRTNNSIALRCHPIDWTDTSEDCFGIPAEEQLVDTPYQFSISGNQYGRVHGFFIEHTFYIVWLDLDHKLYPLKLQ